MWKKECPKPSWQAFTPPPLTGNAHMETRHFKKGLPLPCKACEICCSTVWCNAAPPLSALDIGSCSHWKKWGLTFCPHLKMCGFCLGRCLGWFVQKSRSDNDSSRPAVVFSSYWYPCIHMKGTFAIIFWQAPLLTQHLGIVSLEGFAKIKFSLYS